MKALFKQVKAITVILMYLLIVFFSSSCEPISSSSSVTIDLHVANGFMEFCSINHEGSAGVGFYIVVDAINSSGDTYIFWNKEAGKINDDQGYDFDIDVPSSGDFMVSVLVTGHCMDCCDSSGTDGCNSFQDGDPIFMVPTLMYNITTLPGSITVLPEFVECQDCGC